jgi:drug/metabolite transporter (DMT)-like permease
MNDHGGRRNGLALGFGAACLSGFTVFLNGYAVKHVHVTPTTYTTAKNLVAAAVLTVAIGSVATRAPARFQSTRPAVSVWAGLVYVGLVGGGLAFALYFEGLARTSATTAAFVQKSLVLWVIALAVPLLGERVNKAQWAAVALLIAGAAALGGGTGHLRPGVGPALVLAATLLWAVEVVIAKRLLGSLPAGTVGVTRMGIGGGALLVWLAATGRLDQLTHLGATGWGWAMLTGALLAGYVALWLAALARAQAVEVTAILVFGAFVTAALSLVVQGTTVSNAWGLALIPVGAAVLALMWQRHRRVLS